MKWVTGQPDIVAREIVSSEFQWVRRESDVLIRASSPQHGDFLVLTELQLRYLSRMPRRMRAYAALAEERYDLRVYPVLVNILPSPPSVQIASRYDSELMGIRALQDYRVLNLWTVEAAMVFETPLPPLLPFVPVLDGGAEEPMVRRAVQALRADEALSELEPLLAFFASFVLESRLVQQIMRWDMTVLRESPWYQEILEEGLERGLEQGLERGLEQGLERGLEQGARRQLIRVLEHRFGSVSSRARLQLQEFNLEELEALIEVALEVDSVAQFLDHLPADTDDGVEPNG